MSKNEQSNKKTNLEANYLHLLSNISSAFHNGRHNTIKAINTGLVTTYWQIGQHIVEFEQQGKATAEYGKSLLKQLSKDLKLKHGKGFSLSNLKRFRQFYLSDRNGATLSHQLSWSHHVELLVEYATYGLDTNLFVQKYQLYLPNEAELRKEFEATITEQRHDTV